MVRWICGTKDRDETPSAVGGSDGVDMYSVPCPVSNLSHTFWFAVLEDGVGLERKGVKIDVSNCDLARKTELHGEPMLVISLCWKPYEMEYARHPNLKLDMNCRMDGWHL